MGTKHIRHLVTELAARLSDRDFLRKAGISRPYHAGDICKR